MSQSWGVQSFGATDGTLRALGFLEQIGHLIRKAQAEVILGAGISKGSG